jgi:hypothetical protein
MYSYYSRQATETPERVITINDASSSQVSGLTSFDTDVGLELPSELGSVDYAGTLENGDSSTMDANASTATGHASSSGVGGGDRQGAP